MYDDMTIEELTALAETKRQEALKLIEGDAPSAENITAAQALQAERAEISEVIAQRETAETEAAEALAELNEALAEDLEQPTAETDTEPEAEPEADPEVETDPDAPEVPEAEVVIPDSPAELTEPVAAASRVRRVARRVARPEVPETAERAGVTIIAAANVPDINQGTKLDGIAGIAAALTNRLEGFVPPNGDGKREDLQKFNIAKIQIPANDDRLVVRPTAQFTDAQAILEYASKESRLDGSYKGKGKGSLVAAGGWCAPSETVYDLCEGETLDGIVSLPEIQVARGGINYTSGPQFSDFYGASGPGFVQTEAQAIAGVAKTCVTVSCPPFQDVRMDAVGLCIKTPILTEAGYPELTERFTRGTIVAHEHQKNADVIDRMEALSNANRTPTNGLGSTVSDSLEALELLADEKREKYRLGLEESLEVVIPFWVRAAYKSDLRRRTGQFAPVTDAQMDSYFAASKLAVQWAYDWQLLGQTALQYPTTYRVLMYKAGTFVKGVKDVINLSAVYDAASLAVNTYTGLFVESGLFVARMCWDADRITLPICNAGRVGAHDLTCV